MQRIRTTAHVFLLAATLLAALPMVEAVREWMAIRDFEAGLQVLQRPSERGSDWVVWETLDGAITATHVFPDGPGDRAGIRAGDEFYALEFQQYFNAEDLNNAIAGIRPGQTRDLILVREGKPIDVSVTFAHHPTFLYPRSTGLWQFALWAFTIGAFFHILGLIIARPLARHNRRSRADLIMIGISAMWIIGNTLRLALVELLGPPNADSVYNDLFQALTIIGLIGWIGFPAVLLETIIRDARLFRFRGGTLYRLIHLIPIVLMAGVLTAAVQGHLGPFTLEKLIVPILWYASCFIGASAAVSFLMSLTKWSEVSGTDLQWSSWESLFILLFSTIAALAVRDVIPVFTSMGDSLAAWTIVSAQLLAIVPITLYTVGTLRYGKVDEVLNRAIVYVLVLGLIFFAFVGGLTLLHGFLDSAGSSRIVIEGLFVVLLLVIFERISRRLRSIAASIFATDRQRGRQIINRFQESATEVLDIDSLAQQAIDVAGRVFDARSSILFLRSPADGTWIVKRHRPEPPYLTEQVFESIWSHFEFAPTIWARNPELNEHKISVEHEAELRRYHASLAIPIRGEERAVGMMMLSYKARRGAVYNLDDLDQLRSLAGNLALAVDRLGLVEREKSLAAESSEAHLVALRSQINPHFLFNALNTLLALIGEKPNEAEDVVEHLAAIFRHTLQAGSKPFVSLDEEISLVEHYLSIEKARFGERLDVKCVVDAPLRTHPVPAFAVQTLVENAIKHGLERSRNACRLTITGEPAPEEAARITVQDTGVGIPQLFAQQGLATDRQPFFGIGLSNVYDRLQQLFGRDDLVGFASDPDTGTRAVLIIPPRRYPGT
ncbi:MAG: histidine kinase [Bacteroidota bacterium]|nr:histidine kinase [Bacteroidota bacterium]